MTRKKEPTPNIQPIVYCHPPPRPAPQIPPTPMTYPPYYSVPPYLHHPPPPPHYCFSPQNHHPYAITSPHPTQVVAHPSTPISFHQNPQYDTHFQSTSSASTITTSSTSPSQYRSEIFTREIHVPTQQSDAHPHMPPPPSRQILSPSQSAQIHSDAITPMPRHFFSNDNREDNISDTSSASPSQSKLPPNPYLSNSRHFCAKVRRIL